MCFPFLFEIPSPFRVWSVFYFSWNPLYLLAHGRNKNKADQIGRSELNQIGIWNLVSIKFYNELWSFTHALIHIYGSLIHTFIRSWQKTFQRDLWSCELWDLLSWPSSYGAFWWIFSGAKSVGRLSSMNCLHFILMPEDCGVPFTCPLLGVWLLSKQARASSKFHLEVIASSFQSSQNSICTSLLSLSLPTWHHNDLCACHISFINSQSRVRLIPHCTHIVPGT